MPAPAAVRAWQGVPDRDGDGLYRRRACRLIRIGPPPRLSSVAGFDPLDDLFQGVSDRRRSVSVEGLSGGVVVPDRRGQREDALHDAGYDTSGCAPSVPFEVKLSLEGLVDRFDDLSQRLEQGCARPFPFTFTGRPQQLDSMLGQFAFETRPK